MSGRIKPGKVFDEINESTWTTGNFYVNLTSFEGVMKGSLSVRLGNTRGELQ